MIPSIRRIKSLLQMGKAPKARVTDAEQFHLQATSLDEILRTPNASVVRLRSSQIMRPRDMVLPLVDLLALASICQVRVPLTVFEIGTFTGETTWTMAANLPVASEILTLDLPPAEIPFGFPSYTAGSVFLDTAEQKRITQLYGWSDRYDFSPYIQSVDLMFIDGDHSFASVKSDTDQALRLVKPGGMIIWDDYRYLSCHVGCRGVSDFLHSIKDDLPVRQLTGTRLAVMEVK